MWWDQLCAWIASQYEHDSDLDQIQWKQLIVSIPEETRCPEEYQPFLVRWRALIAEEQDGSDAFSLAYTQKLLSIIDSTLAHIASL